MKVVIPGQNILVDDLNKSGVNPTWYERFSFLFSSLGMFMDKGAYSEGTYTPVLSATGGTVPTFTAIPLTGKYIKIGRAVMLQIVAQNTAGGTAGAGANQLSISLPLPVSSTAISGRAFAGSMLNGTATDLAFLDITAGSSTALLWQQTVSGSKVDQVALNCADFSNVTRAISFASITYPVN
jgi:hypothetical protein